MELDLWKVFGNWMIIKTSFNTSENEKQGYTSKSKRLMKFYQFCQIACTKSNYAGEPWIRHRNIRRRSTIELLLSVPSIASSRSKSNSEKLDKLTNWDWYCISWRGNSVWSPKMIFEWFCKSREWWILLLFSQFRNLGLIVCDLLDLKNSIKYRK